MIIIGAGMSGLLCGALNPDSTIYEAGPERESDHKAVFRCRSDQIGKMLGIPFKKVEVHKSIWLDGREVEPTPRINHMYSQKVSGKISGRSITNIDSVERYIPPDNFIETMKKRCNIEYGERIDISDINCRKEPIISTIPMFNMAQILKHDMPEFKYRPIYITTIKLPNCDSYCTCYYPDLYSYIYRASITGNQLIIESTSSYIDELQISEVFDSLGIEIGEFNPIGHTQKIGKMSSINNKAREHFVYQSTIIHGIYSLGRFATWRPKVMLDDVLNDIFVIRRLIENGNYATLKKGVE